MVALNIGDQVGAYRIEEKLGQGGMATVYKAYHDRLERYVAIKVLHPAITEDDTFIGRFEREARVVARLEHPNIVPVYDFAEHDGRPYLVMKLIDGETLKERLGRGPLSPDEGLRIVEAVGSALAFAHGHGVLHRDVKPSNVIMSSDGDIFLADFGLARIAQAGESTISQDTMLGTPHYISPEQAKGVRDLGPETDIYSFGVMLYEFVVGRVPFVADTPFSIIHDHIYSPLPPPHEFNPNVPDEIEQVLYKALAKEPSERYSSASELVADFHRASASMLPGVSTEQRAFDVSPRASTLGAAAQPTVVGHLADETSPPVETASASTSRPAAAGKASQRKKPARRWIWAGVGLVVLLAVLGVGALAAWRLTRPTATPEPTAVAAAETHAAPAPTVAPVVDVHPTLTPEAAPASDGAPVIPDLVLPDDLDPVAVHRIEQAYEQLQKDPTSPPLYINLALELAMAGLSKQALTMLELGATIAEHAPEYYLEAAEKAQDGDRLVAALMITEQGLLHNRDSERLKLKATILMGLSARVDDALPVFESYSANFPGWLAPQLATARWYMFHDELTRSAEIINGLLPDHDQDPELHYTYGELLFLQGESDAAIEQFQWVLDSDSAAELMRRAARQQIERIESGGSRLVSTPSG
ncbi:MAG: protein kinase [Anaerolineales bacterium]